MSAQNTCDWCDERILVVLITLWVERERRYEYIEACGRHLDDAFGAVRAYLRVFAPLEGSGS